MPATGRPRRAAAVASRESTRLLITSVGPSRGKRPVGAKHPLQVGTFTPRMSGLSSSKASTSQRPTLSSYLSSSSSASSDSLCSRPPNSSSSTSTSASFHTAVSRLSPPPTRQKRQERQACRAHPPPPKRRNAAPPPPKRKNPPRPRPPPPAPPKVKMEYKPRPRRSLYIPDPDICVVESTDRSLCPLTKAVLVDALKSRCGHVYSRHAIVKHLSISPFCPVCSARVNVRTLMPDPDAVKRSRQLEEAWKAKVKASVLAAGLVDLTQINDQDDRVQRDRHDKEQSVISFHSDNVQDFEIINVA